MTVFAEKLTTTSAVVITAPDLGNARELLAALCKGLEALGCACNAATENGSVRAAPGSCYILPVQAAEQSFVQNIYRERERFFFFGWNFRWYFLRFSGSN